MKQAYIKPVLKIFNVQSQQLLASSQLYSTSKEADDSAVLSTGHRGKWGSSWGSSWGSAWGNGEE